MSVKRSIQSWLSKTVLNPIERTLEPVATVLRYHSVRPTDFQPDVLPPALSHTPELFEAQLCWLRENYQVISLLELTERLRNGAPLTSRLAAITFDDGFLDNYLYAAPILKKYQLPATFYPTVGLVGSVDVPWFCRTWHAFRGTTVPVWAMPGRGDLSLATPELRNIARQTANRRIARLVGEEQRSYLSQLELALEVSSADMQLMMDWEHLEALLADGHEIGSHTLCHPNLTLLADDEIAGELMGSKRLLDDKLGTQTTHFSYPNPILQPHWDMRVADIARECGYRTGATSTNGYVRFGSDPLTMYRLAPSNDVVDDLYWHILYRRRHLRSATIEDG